MAESDDPRERLTTVSLRADVVERAEALGVDVREAAERGLRRAIEAHSGPSWAEENREAIESYNAWVEEHGLPLAKYRMF